MYHNNFLLYISFKKCDFKGNCDFGNNLKLKNFALILVKNKIDQESFKEM